MLFQPGVRRFRQALQDHFQPDDGIALPAFFLGNGFEAGGEARQVRTGFSARSQQIGAQQATEPGLGLQRLDLVSGVEGDRSGERRRKDADRRDDRAPFRELG